MESFLHFYGLDALFETIPEGLSHSTFEVRVTIIAMYYSFTSLSTVGFGDYNPRSNAERLLTAFILLGGVSVFSYIMGIFVDILNSFKEMNAEFDLGDELTNFF
jgi:hypothetical protein